MPSSQIQKQSDSFHFFFSNPDNRLYLQKLIWNPLYGHLKIYDDVSRLTRRIDRKIDDQKSRSGKIGRLDAERAKIEIICSL